MIVPIVEGQSEERAMGVLMRRVLEDEGVFDLQVARPFRVKRQRVVRAGELERTLAHSQRSRPGASALFVVLDADDDCPASLSAELLTRGAAETDLELRVVFSKIEIEAWLLAAVESLRGIRGIRQDAAPPAEPEQVRNAKGLLTQLMEGNRGYVATDDLPALVARADLSLAATRSPSFAKFRRDMASVARV